MHTPTIFVLFAANNSLFPPCRIFPICSLAYIVLNDEQPARSQVTHGGGYKKPRAQYIFSWKSREHFTYKFIKGRHITVQCEMCLPATELLSASKDSTSNLKKHLEVSLTHHFKGSPSSPKNAKICHHLLTLTLFQSIPAIYFFQTIGTN